MSDIDDQADLIEKMSNQAGAWLSLGVKYSNTPSELTPEDLTFLKNQFRAGREQCLRAAPRAEDSDELSLYVKYNEVDDVPNLLLVLASAISDYIAGAKKKGRCTMLRNQWHNLDEWYKHGLVLLSDA